MPRTRSAPLALCCHSNQSAPWVAGLQVELRTATRGRLNLAYRVDGELSRMRIPSPLLPERADGLWRHTCFEVFVGGSNRHDYLEYNFSPSGQWQIYAFQDYRRDGRLPATESPSISRALTRGALQLEARIRLPGAVDEASLRLGICAALEDTDGRLSYWALQHPTGKPDFHDPATFILTPGETP